VVAEAPFHSYSAMANDKLPGAGLILEDTYAATSYVAKIAPIPLLLIHGTSDVVVPYSQSVRLLAEAGDPKSLITIEDGDHIDSMTRRHGKKYQDEMIAFFDSALEKR